jgi:hypothetical protein
MKITIEISRALLSRARWRAKREGVTFGALVERGLSRMLAESRSAPFKLRRSSFKGKGLQVAMRDASWEDLRELAYGRRGDGRTS